MDTVTPQQRSENMRRIRSKGTRPEVFVRTLVYRLGYRYRLHVKSLPGKPDLVFWSKQKVIFVHGCFWHQHNQSSCKAGRRPKSNRRYWNSKLQGNRKRDQRHELSLRASGWKILVLWECELTKCDLALRISHFLQENGL